MTGPAKKKVNPMVEAMRKAESVARHRAREERRAAGTLKGATANKKKRKHGRTK